MKLELFHYVDRVIVNPVRPEQSFTMKVPAITIDFGDKEIHAKLSGSDFSANLFYRPYEINIRWPIQLQLQLHVNRYELGGFISEHQDMIRPGEWQYRIQFILENAKKGGELLCDHFIVNLRWFKLFKPANHKHQVTKVEEGRRRLLNFGIRYAPHSVKPCPF